MSGENNETYPAPEAGQRRRDRDGGVLTLLHVDGAYWICACDCCGLRSAWPPETLRRMPFAEAA